MIPQYQTPQSYQHQQSPASSSQLGVLPRVIPPSARKHFKETGGGGGGITDSQRSSNSRVFKPTNIQPQGQPVLESLTPEEGQKLLEVWRSSNFIEFNIWCQIANARLYYKVNENSDQTNQKIIKSYLCTLSLSFKERPGVQAINQLGFGKNKKSAKKDALEKCIIELIQSGKIIYGLRNKKFLEKAVRLQAQGKLGVAREEFVRPPLKEKTKVQKIIQKLSKRMQQCIRNDRFIDGCTMVAQIVNKKKADWNEISFIWSHSLLKHNILMVYALMEIIFEGKSSQQAMTPSQTMNFLPGNPDPIKRSNEEKVHQDLLNYYCTSRFKPHNPYDLLDICNHELNNLELDPSAKMSSDEEIDSRLLEDPYSSNTQSAFIIMSNNNPEQTFDQRSGIQQSLASSMLQLNLIQMSTDFGGEQQSQQDMNIPQNSRISYTLVEEMYQSLFYQGDLTFCLHIAEKMYQMIRLNSEDFANNQAAQYYSNKKNMLFIEQIEQMYQTFMKPINRDIDYYTSIKGSINKIGNKFAYEVIIFTPQEPDNLVKSKILKKGSSSYDPPDPLNMLQEDDFVLLTTCYIGDQEPNTNTTNNNNADSPLTLYLNQYAKNPNKIKDNQNFVQCIKDSQQNIEYSLIGLVKEVEKDFRLKIFVLPNRVQSDILREQNRIWRVTRLVNKYKYDVYSEALVKFSTKLSTSPMLMQIILATPSHMNSHSLQQMAEAKIVGDRKEVPTNLNESQHIALKAASTQLLTLIHGPPGSGKTILSVEIVLDWLRNNDEQVLICAPNNLQLDIIHSELVKANIIAERVGPTYDEKIDAINHQKIKNSKNPAFNVPNLKFVMAKKHLSQAHVICATCDGLGSPYLKNIKFTRVLIDGATQITEVATISALTRDCQQLVLIGDHKQPGPKIKSIFAESKGLRISLFERLAKQGLKLYSLEVQYRMHKTLSYFPVQHFYNGAIRDGVNPDNRPLVNGFQWPNPEFRLAFINVKGPETNYAASILNLKETEVILLALMQILKSQNLRSYNVGILTPYEAQKRRIKYEVFHQATKYPNLFGLSIDEIQNITKNTQIIDIETPETNQMLEKELVFVSTVRSNTKGIVGILKDLRQINVMLTKARRGVIVVGDADTLKNDNAWREWLNWVRINRLEIIYNKN